MPKKRKDYYRVLHLDPSADAKMVEHAYWHLARGLQAAAQSDPSAYERRLEELNEAYSVLGTPALRAEYDRSRRGALPESETEDGHRRSVLRLPLLLAGATLGPVLGLGRLLFISASAWSRVRVSLRRPRVQMAAGFRRPSRERQPAIDPADLRASTADTIARWRKGADAVPPLRPSEPSEGAEPSTDSSEDPPR